MKQEEIIKMPEILAPAGTYEALEAAVNAGADAVYLGGDLFSARAYAGNFSKEELLKALDYCHLFDVRVYLTVNTLFKENEIGMLPAFMEPFYRAGVDAALVQDPGVLHVLRDRFPLLPLHASTQMSVSSSYGAAFLKSLGFTRIVPARELSLEEIRDIKREVDIEVETFVHGAMCFAYSGKCLFSSFLGGRSGNRGRCAQPCRQCYACLMPGSLPDKPETSFLMSLKDMCALDLLPELIEAGIDSFKIEGRMKKPEYVAQVTHAYKVVRDVYLQERTASGKSFDSWDLLKKQEFYDLTGKLKKDLRDIYNRGGFYTGYYKTEKAAAMFAADRPNHEGLLIGRVRKVSGPDIRVFLKEELNAQDVVEIRPAGVELTAAKGGAAGQVVSLKGKELRKIRPGMDVFRTRNNRLLKEIREQLIEKKRSVPVQVFAEAVEGRPLRLTLSGAGIEVCVTGSIVERAAKKPVTETQILEKLKKTGGSGLTFICRCRIGEQAFFSMSEFNALRREAMELFRKEKAGAYHRNEA